MNLPAEVSTMPIEDVAAEMAEGRKLLTTKNLAFFLSLESSRLKYGKLTEKQEFWYRKMYAQALGLEAKPEPKVVQVGNFAGVMKLFAKAKQHLKYPAIMLKNAIVGDVKLSLAGPNAKAPGTVNVTDGKPYGQGNVWYGRVSGDGDWQVNPKVSEDKQEVVGSLLKSLSRSPAKVAAEHGKLTGNCCFCSKKLTDPKSTAVGFGLTCAGHYGLTEEWKKAASVLATGNDQTA